MKANQLLFLLITFVATAASAGHSVNFDVYVNLSDPSQGVAGGSVAGARNSADTRQSIVCAVTVNYINTSSPARVLKCVAVDAAGLVGSCTLNSPPQSVVDLVTSLDDTSYVMFWWTKSNQVCTQIKVERNSMQIPSGGTTSLTSARTAAPAVTPMADAQQQK